MYRHLLSQAELEALLPDDRQKVSGIPVEGDELLLDEPTSETLYQQVIELQAVVRALQLHIEQLGERIQVLEHSNEPNDESAAQAQQNHETVNLKLSRTQRYGRRKNWLFDRMRDY